MYRSDYQKRRDLPTVEADKLRQALRHFASGVTIVTAEHDGVRYGITVSAFASVSLQPPIVMVSLGNNSSLVEMVLESEHFAVHILSADQQDLSHRFATASTAEEKFDGLEYEKGPSGAPTLRSSLAVIDCVLDQSLIVGTHTVMFGRVVHASSSEAPGSPLIYYHREYRTLNDKRQ